jgi:hypothetical protein
MAGVGDRIGVLLGCKRIKEIPGGSRLISEEI